MSSLDAVDRSSTRRVSATEVGGVEAPRFGGAEHADDTLAHPKFLRPMPRGHTGANQKMKTQLGTCDGVAEAGHRLDWALTVAHAVWHFAGAS